MSKINVEEMVSLRMSGFSSKEIAEHFSVNPSSVSKLLKSRGFKGRNPKLNESVFSHNNPEACYWLGFLMADGSLREANGGITLSLELSIKDIEHLEKFKNFLQIENKIETTKGGKACRVRVGNKKLGENLKTLGLTPRKTFTCKLRDERFLNYDFCRGYIDGDGCLGRYQTQDVLVVVGSKCILGQLNRVLITGNPILPDGKIFRLTKSGVELKELLNNLYYEGCIALERKQKRAKEIINV